EDESALPILHEDVVRQEVDHRPQQIALIGDRLINPFAFRDVFRHPVEANNALFFLAPLRLPLDVYPAHFTAFADDAILAVSGLAIENLLDISFGSINVFWMVELKIGVNFTPFITGYPLVRLFRNPIE